MQFKQILILELCHFTAIFSMFMVTVHGTWWLFEIHMQSSLVLLTTSERHWHSDYSLSCDFVAAFPHFNND